MFHCFPNTFMMFSGGWNGRQYPDRNTFLTDK